VHHSERVSPRLTAWQPGKELRGAVSDLDRERIITRRDNDDEDPHGQVVEEVVREHDTGHFRGRRESSY